MSRTGATRLPLLPLVPADSSGSQDSAAVRSLPVIILLLLCASGRESRAVCQRTVTGGSELIKSHTILYTSVSRATPPST